MGLSRKGFHAVYIIIISIILLGFLAAGLLLYFLQIRTDPIPVVVRITNDGITEEIEPWYDGDDDVWYYFLPSYANEDNTVLHTRVSGCFLQDEEMHGDSSIRELETDRVYDLEQRSLLVNLSSPVIFKRSANVATMYIRTATGTMDRINKSKDNKELAAVTLYDETGKADYTGRGRDTINSRGNSTWNLNKKPFKLTLAADESLLGMKSAKNWVLLSNGFDKTNLRNKLILDFGARVNMCWTPHCEFVDVYLNGEYNGLYLLTEKVEVGDNRLELKDMQSDFLVESTSKTRLKKGETGFELSDGSYYIINYPQKPDKARVAEIQSILQVVSDSIHSGTLDGMEVDSWVKRYMIDEIFVNRDAIEFSSFYHYDAAAGNMFAGPIWDYDLTLGNDALSPTTSARFPNQIFGLWKPWYRDLYENEVFLNEVKRQYRETFRSALIELLANELPHLTEKINDANVCNTIRWDTMYRDNHEYDKDLNGRIEELSAFLLERLGYLDSLWYTDRKMEVVKWYAADKESLIRVSLTEHGTALKEQIAQDEQWYLLNDDTKYDPSQPVMETLCLYNAALSPAEHNDTEKNVDEETE